MALVRKDAVVQFRVPSEVLDEFRAWCEGTRRKTVSEELRGYMEWRVEEARKGGDVPPPPAPKAAPALKQAKGAKRKDPEVAATVKAATGGVKVSRTDRRRIERLAHNDKD
ncbi:hypothetical protein [Cupriavidus metallidurans]|uniref:hypothetical protein n=1 Tax=Cupriavidus metallidurans TaxID=119219 RepID=UPI001CCC071B|nr:hypothetical protein [Cupriavidus metallidurans]UBM07933.1 hypothetical protein LAI70_09525 [Cupriavidus metallidurans]